MKKTAILPVVSVLCVGVTAVSGVEISGEVQNLIADVVIGIASAISIYGIYKDHKKKGDVE